MTMLIASRDLKRLPRAILGFGLAYVAFAFVAFANNLSMIDGFQSQLSTALGSEAPVWLGYTGFGMRLIGRLLLAWFIVVRTSEIARLLVFFFALPWAWQIPSGLTGLLESDTAWLPWLTALILQFLALGCLLVSQARQWFARKGRTLANDIDDFS